MYSNKESTVKPISIYQNVILALQLFYLLLIDKLFATGSPYASRFVNAGVELDEKGLVTILLGIIVVVIIMYFIQPLTQATTSAGNSTTGSAHTMVTLVPFIVVAAVLVMIVMTFLRSRK